jgi:mitochondrial enoyl-[acyl-carrier protein] reductase / trans-2-enoyl-CoA reductase
LPKGIDLQQAAMVRVNPPTAHLMLTDHADLKPGDWIIQNAANSAVGQLVITLAKARGIRLMLHDGIMSFRNSRHLGRIFAC